MTLPGCGSLTRNQIAPSDSSSQSASPRLTEKLLAERDGILAWAVAGCLVWQREGLKPPACVVSATEEYFESEDALGRWLDERCVRTANAKSLTAELFTDWKQWAETSGEFIGSQRRFSDLLITRGLEKWRNSVGVRGFQGIGLKHPPMASARARGHTPTDDNEADALALLHWAVETQEV